MIAFDFEYHQPVTLEEAVQLYADKDQEGKQPLYFSGGTEIITHARSGLLYSGAIIDIKQIAEYKVQRAGDGKIVLGAGITLNQLAASGFYPLLAKAASGVADHTSRNKITLGGNIAGQTPYRETVLPLLLADSQVRVASPEGVHTYPIQDVFDQSLRLAPGSLLVQTITDQQYARVPFSYSKKTRLSKLDYPLVTVAAIQVNDYIRVAFSGVCQYPFRSQIVEELLNDRAESRDSRVVNALAHLPGIVLHDPLGSREYRVFMTRLALHDMLDELEGADY